jgi:aminoglycoside phosphotransferase (APT) family kinase protein
MSQPATLTQVAIDIPLVRRLIAAQFPQWDGLPVRPVQPGGWDNRTFRLGDRMSVRMPSRPCYALQVEKEQRWLPRLAPLLPLPIPTPLAMGEPGEGYPWNWSVYGWLDGEVASPGKIGDPSAFAEALAEFLLALQRIDPTGGLAPGEHNFFRGGPLATYDEETRQALRVLSGTIDTDAAAAIWEDGLSAEWRGAPVWFHGDVARGNLLVEGGRLRAVIDFGTSGVGDPACDLAVAWTLLEGEGRRTFRAGLQVDEGTWARGRCWALWKALIMVAGFTGAAPVDVEDAHRVLAKILADRG